MQKVFRAIVNHEDVLTAERSQGFWLKIACFRITGQHMGDLLPIILEKYAVGGWVRVKKHPFGTSGRILNVIDDQRMAIELRPRSMPR